ncbi:MAG: penicillin-binding transpeptidase domain-containing protein, partial [Thermodesulfobacteriota bacterium]
VTPEEANKALKKSLAIKPKKTDEIWAGPYFTEHVRQYLEDKYGQELLYKGGLHVHTTMDVEMQKAANSAVDFGLRAYDKRRGYRGAIQNIQEQSEKEQFITEAASILKKFPPVPGRYYKATVQSPNPKDRSLTVMLGDRKGIISYPDLVWAKLYNPTDNPDGGTIVGDAMALFNEGDVVWVGVKKVPDDEEEPLVLKLEQEPLAEGALLAVETDTGFVRAIVGGLSFAKSKFNRAVQAKRQPGSAFKPIIYAAALDKEYTPATIVMDSPIVFEAEKTEEEKNTPDWTPRNFDEKFSGPTTVRDALAKSRNVITVKILKDIGVDYAGAYAARLGITSPLARDLSLALGSSAVSMTEMVMAFSTFANYGIKTEQIFVTKVTDDKGALLEENHPVSESVMDADTAYLITNLLQGVVENGTGRRAKALGRPVAAKTGTTNNLNDAWFIGYVPGLAAASWIGFDSEKNLGKHETGSRAASPIWIKFMEQALANTPARNFSVPPGIEFVKIDSKTGLLAGRGTKEPLFEAFKEGTAPAATTEGQSESQSDEFFLMDSTPTGKIAIPPDEGEEDPSE